MGDDTQAVVLFDERKKTGIQFFSFFPFIHSFLSGIISNATILREYYITLFDPGCFAAQLFFTTQSRIQLYLVYSISSQSRPCLHGEISQ